MSKIRVEHNANYTVMSNYHLRDNTLSLKAKGLLSLMLSLPEAWDYTVAGLAYICKEGKDAIRAALEELERAGYLKREQTRTVDGSFAGNDYIVMETPSTPLSEKPSTGNPMTENPLTGNPTEINKDIINKDLKNTPIIPTGDKPSKTKRDKSLPKWKPERFSAFWQFYASHGRGEAKQKAVRAWDKLQPDDAMIDAMAIALSKQVQSRQWQEGIGIPYASSWLNGRRWEDVLPDDAPKKGKTVESGEVVWR